VPSNNELELTSGVWSACAPLAAQLSVLRTSDRSLVRLGGGAGIRSRHEEALRSEQVTREPAVSSDHGVAGLNLGRCQ